jgi:ribosomal protein L28
MASICENCEKAAVMGRQHRHKRGVAGKRWKNRTTVMPKLFKANLQKVTLEVDGKPTRLTLCAKCIKKLKKDTK